MRSLYGQALAPGSVECFLDDKEKINIVDITALSIKDAQDYFERLPLSKQDQEIASVVIKEIQSRLGVYA
jgi:excinuclease UvrABC ATPase subunit